MLIPSGYRGTEPIWNSGVTGGCQELSVLEAEVSLTRDKWEKHPIVTSPEAPCILGIDRLPKERVFQGPKGIPVGFWCGHCECREDQTALYPVWLLRRSLCCGLAVN